MKNAVVMQAAASTQEHQRDSADKTSKDNDRKSGASWSVTHKMRLPHKVGLPLGSGGGSDSGCGQ